MFWAPGQPRTATVARPPATGSRREARGASTQLRRPDWETSRDQVRDLLHVNHTAVVTWYGKPFDPVDIDERWVRLRPSHAGGPPPGRPREASRHSAVRFDLTHLCVPLWTATGRQLELLSTVSLRTACSRRPARLADAPAAERLAALSETKNRPVWRHHESSAVVRGNPRANCTRNGVRPRLAAAVPPKNYGHDATMRGFRTERGGRRATHLFAVVYRANPATVCILMHNFRPDCTGRIQPCLEVTVRPSRYPALRQSGKHRRTASRSGPGLSLRRDIRPVLAVDNASVRLARPHVHTGFTERLQSRTSRN